MLTRGGATLPAGDHLRQAEVGGRRRSYLVHLPPSAPPAAGWPVVLVFHGGGTCAEAMIRFSGMSEKADRAGFVAVYPNGTGRVARALTFNAGSCCGYASHHGVDDTAFVRAILAELPAWAPIDRQRIYATGMSNGAMLCYRLACEMADRLAAIAPVAGPMAVDDGAPLRPVPVCHFHGTEDEFVPFRGGRGPRSRTGVHFRSVDETIAWWVQANRARPRPDVTRLPTRVEDGTFIIRRIYPAEPGGAEVVLYVIYGGGHTWPGRPSSLAFLGRTTQNLVAADVIWEFFARHRRDA